MSSAVGRNDHNRVIELSMKALRKNPNNLSALSLAATHFEFIGDSKRAKEFAYKALVIDPGDFDLHCLLIRMLDPVEDHDALLDEAKWLVALSETTLPEAELELESAASHINHIPFCTKLANASKQNFEERKQYQQTYIQWATDIISNHDVSNA